MKNHILMALILASGMLVSNIGSSAEMTPQQKMVACNAGAKKLSLSGKERQKFMSNCLKKDSSIPDKMSKESPQKKMASCSGEASKKKLRGDDYKKYMSSCLKKR